MAATETPPTGEQTEQEKLECTVEIDDLGAWQKKIALTIPRAEIDAELEKEFKELRQSADVPGFRKGRAPLALVEKRFGSDVANQAKYRLLARAFEQIDDENDFEVLGEPDLKLDDVELPDEGDFTLEYQIEVKPEFELPELEGVQIAKSIVDVTPERVDAALQSLRERLGRHEDITDEGAQNGDTVRCDVTLKVEGQDEPEVITDHTLPVAEQGGVGGVLIEKLDGLLKGAKIGDTKAAKSTAPESHANEDYRGKQVDIEITVKGIHRHIPAELNAEFFERLGVADEAELRQLLEDDLEQQADQEAKREMSRQAQEYLLDSLDFELPPNITARHANRALQKRFYDLMGMGVTADKISENIERLKAATAEEAGKELKLTFILDAVADKMEIQVTEAEINGWIAMIARRQHRRPEKVRDELRRDGRINDLAQQIRHEKALERILENASIVDAPTPDAKEKAPAKKKTTKSAGTKSSKKPAAKAEKPSDDVDEDKPAKRSSVKRKPPAKKKESE